MPDNPESLAISYSNFGGFCGDCKHKPNCTFEEDMQRSAEKASTLGGFRDVVGDSHYLEGPNQITPTLYYCTAMCQPPRFIDRTQGDSLPFKRTFSVYWDKNHEP